MEFRNIVILFSSVLLIACGGSDGDDNETIEPPIAVIDYDYQILMMGNSHTAPIPTVLSQIFKHAQPGVTVSIILAPGGMFLIDRMEDTANIALLNQEPWSHVILQALKYSSSGTMSYPTTGAEYFIREATAIGATPIMYPEHPRQGNTWEAEYLFQLHTSVAAEHPACVAPIGFVWDDFQSKSTLELHISDGNHANTAGKFLTALVLYHAITQADISALSFIPDVGVSEADQQDMRDSVHTVVTTYIPCVYLNN